VEETNATATSVTSETTAVYVKTDASTQTGITELVTSQERTSGLITAKKDPPVNVTTQLPSTIDLQTTDFQYHSLLLSAGNNFSLYCSSPVKTIFRWGYSSLGSTTGPLIIYNGQKISREHDLAEKVSVSNCGDRRCTFNVNDVQLADAGFFSCVLPDVKKYWSITLLGKYTAW